MGKNHEAAFSMVKMQGGVFGAVSDSESVAATMRKLALPAHSKMFFQIGDLKGRWHSKNFYPAEDTKRKFQQEQDIDVGEGAVIATKFTDGGDPFVKAGNVTWFFDLPRDPTALKTNCEGIMNGTASQRLLKYPLGASFYGQLRGGGESGEAKEFFWQPARITVLDADKIEVCLLEKCYSGTFHRGALPTSS